jgi:glycosyltransferase involved in cell wall biosynthesis
VHVLYGDEQLDVLLRHRSMLSAPLVATFHLPVSRVAERFERFQRDLLKGIDAAVVVSRCQLPSFGRWLGSERVVYVPHGVDTERFSPGVREQDRDRVRLLTVGDHMRDWVALHRIIDECNTRDLPVQFDIVARREYWPYLTGCANVRLRAGIAEEELVALYRQADALLMPVTDATANNAVLEAQACGTPAISNDVGGIPDYVDDTTGWLFQQGEALAIVKLIGEFCSDPAIVAPKREAARHKSLQFSWGRIAEQMQAIYKTVAEGNSPADASMFWEQIPIGRRGGETHAVRTR